MDSRILSDEPIPNCAPPADTCLLHGNVRAAGKDRHVQAFVLVVALHESRVESRRARAADTSPPGKRDLCQTASRGVVAARTRSTEEADKTARGTRGNAWALRPIHSGIRGENTMRPFAGSGLIVSCKNRMSLRRMGLRSVIDCRMAMSASAPVRVTAMNEAHARGFRVHRAYAKDPAPVPFGALIVNTHGRALMRATNAVRARMIPLLMPKRAPSAWPARS
jgi:hypothetical protein